MARKKAGLKGRGAAKQGNGVPVRADDLIDMDEAIGILKTTRPTFYRWLRAGKVKGMKVGRQWRFTRSDVERFLKGEAPQIALPVDVEPLIQQLRKTSKGSGVDVSGFGDDNDISSAVDLMIGLGAGMHCSDIHISAHITDDARMPVAVIRYRVDGVLSIGAEFDIRLLPAVVERIKVLTRMDVNETQLPQDGRMVASVHGSDIDMRVGVVPASLGESVTVRVLDASSAPLQFASLDYAPNDRARLLEAIHAPYGMVLITGPTGSGKTTVLYSCLNEIARHELKVLTAEDPVEYLLPWATQIAVNPNAGLGFAQIVRAMLRADPDVMMVGEIRDRETLACCHQAALTGHMVMTTLHTNDAVSALKRMVDIKADPFVVTDATRLVSAQRLVRKLCQSCKNKKAPSADQLEWLQTAARSGGLQADVDSPVMYGSVGCGKCNQTGYRGRNIVAEMLEMSPEIGRALQRDASLDELRLIAIGQGMTTMAADGIRRVLSGETSIDEVMRVTGD